jgi:hypothetical protein
MAKSSILAVYAEMEVREKPTTARPTNLRKHTKTLFFPTIHPHSAMTLIALARIQAQILFSKMPFAHFSPLPLLNLISLFILPLAQTTRYLQHVHFRLRLPVGSTGIYMRPLRILPLISRHWISSRRISARQHLTY